jgi:non-specific protein-tyrosine kinase
MALTHVTISPHGTLSLKLIDIEGHRFVELDLRRLLQIAARRGWLVLLLMVVAGAAAWLRSANETPLYSSTAVMLVNPGVGQQMNESNAIYYSQQLAGTYQQMVTSGPVLTQVQERLDVDFLETSISASAAEFSQFIYVTTTDTDPERAALVANLVVEEFVIYMQERAQERAETARSGMDIQIAALEERIVDIDTQIGQLQSGEQTQAVTQQIEDLRLERSYVVQSLTNLNTDAVTVSAEVLASSAQIEPVNEAFPPGQPFSPQPRSALLLGMFVGLLLGVALAALLEFMDNTVKPDQNMAAHAGAPLLATIPTLSKLQPGGGQVYAFTQTRSAATEAIRLLRTNLEFAAAASPIRTLTITSPGAGEGKSTTVANLGVTMAQAGLKTVIVDADLRRPSQHRIFHTGDEKGLTTLLTQPGMPWLQASKKVALPGLYLIPSGPIPPNPSDLVSSQGFANILARIAADADMVLVDSPPVLAASDALAISAHTDGVLIVCQSSRTRIDALRHAAESLHQGGVRVIGVVLNRQKRQAGASYHGEYYGPVEVSAAD